MKIRPVGAELFLTDGRTDRQTDMPKSIFVFRNNANAPKNKSDRNFKICFYLCLYVRNGNPILNKPTNLSIGPQDWGGGKYPFSVRVIVLPLRTLSFLTFVSLF